MIDDDFFRLISVNITFVNILGQKCKIANVLHLALSELHSNYSKTCCSKVLKLIIVNMAIKDFNPCLILQEIQKLNESCNEKKRPKLYVISKDYQQGDDIDSHGLVH